MASHPMQQIRMAEEEDIPKIRQIYHMYASNIASTVTFEEETPSLAEMTHRWQIIRENNQPFLVCEIDDIIAGAKKLHEFVTN